MSSPTWTLMEADKRFQLAYSSGQRREEDTERKEAASRLPLQMSKKVAPHAVKKQRAQESRSISQLQTGMTPPSSVAEGEHIVQGWHSPASPRSRGTSTPVAQPLHEKRTRYQSCREAACGSQLPFPSRKPCGPAWGKGGDSILKEILRMALPEQVSTSVCLTSQATASPTSLSWSQDPAQGQSRDSLVARWPHPCKPCPTSSVTTDTGILKQQE